MTRRGALQGAVALALALILGACSSANPTLPPRAHLTGPASSSSGCGIRHTPVPGWVPKGLLPPGTFPLKTLTPATNFHRVLFVVAGAGVAEVHHFIKTRWPREGYVLGRLQLGGERFSGAFVRGAARGTFLVEPRCGDRQAFLYLGFSGGRSSSSPS